jgi:putative transcriptional regulator
MPRSNLNVNGMCTIKQNRLYRFRRFKTLFNHLNFFGTWSDPQTKAPRNPINVSTIMLFQDDTAVNFVSISRGPSGAIDALLGAYAAGSLSRPLHALVASHLTLKSDNRSYVAALEQLAASTLEDAWTGPVSARDARLASIFAQSAPLEEVTPPSFVPAPLAGYLGQPFDGLAWKTMIPGLREVKLEDAPGCEASLLWIKAGRAMPRHTHAGMEATLVLKGSFIDSAGHYGRGDISVVDSDVDHKPVAGMDEDCICFAVSEGPVKLTGPIARLFQRLIRH